MIPITRALSLILFLALLLPAESVRAQQTDNGRSVLEGVYTADQADRGARVFESECSLCHAPAEFGGRIFQLTWQGRTVGALFTQIRTTMPLDRPGHLSAEQYSAVVTYILRLNRYPHGEHALPTDPDALNLIRIEPLEEPGR